MAVCLFQMDNTLFAQDHEEERRYWLLGSKLIEILFYLTENITVF